MSLRLHHTRSNASAAPFARPEPILPRATLRYHPYHRPQMLHATPETVIESTNWSFYRQFNNDSFQPTAELRPAVTRATIDDISRAYTMHRLSRSRQEEEEAAEIDALYNTPMHQEDFGANIEALYDAAVASGMHSLE